MKQAWVIASVALFMVSGALARNINGEYDNSPNHQWFEQQTNADGRSCCGSADGQVYDGNYTMNNDGSVTLDLDAGPYQIAASNVLKGPNPTGHPIWWHNDYNGVITTYCFSPGTLG